MKIPFSIEQFLMVFEKYNSAIWPMQIVLSFLAIVGIGTLFIKSKFSQPLIVSILAFFWLWMGAIYHIMHFSTINKLAVFFGLLFILQALLFLFWGIIKKKLSFQFERSFSDVMGLMLFCYSLIIYPVLGYFLGHIFPQSPTFGAPCPTVIYTFGFLLVSKHKVPVYLMIVPLLWSLIGFSAAVNLRIYEDFGLLLAGILSFIIIIKKNRNPKKSFK